MAFKPSRGKPLNYLSLLPEFVQHNISHVRFSAHNDEIFNVAKRVRQILNQDSNYIQTIQGVNGFWHGKAGNTLVV